MDSQNQPNQPTQKPKGGAARIILIILVILLIIAIIIGGIFFIFKQSAKKNLESKQTLEQMQEKLDELNLELVKNQEAEKNAAEEKQKEAEKQAVQDSWNTYTNDIYGYEVKYPTNATVSEAKKDQFSMSPEEKDQGLTFDDIYEKYTGKICVSFDYDLGYINISAPENESFKHLICGRTGKAYESTEKTENLTIDGLTVTAKGFEEKGPGETLDFHNETMVVTLDDGTRIEYGSRPDANSTYDDYLKNRDTLIQIVETYLKIK